MKFYQRLIFCLFVLAVITVVVLKRRQDHERKLISIKNGVLRQEMSRLQLNLSQPLDPASAPSFFGLAASWVSDRQIYPHHSNEELSSILHYMASLKIVKADVLPKGTQIKLLLLLEGGQRVVFKQKRYERDYVVPGKAYDGYDRHNAEIAAFHLDRVLDFRRAPLVVGRFVNVKTEILPVATEALKATFRTKDDGTLCYFGKCLYCKEEEMACAGKDNVMEGSVTLWLPEKWSKFTKLRHPYQRTYKEGKVALWERDESYCNRIVKNKPPYNKGDRLLDITDGAAFDYLIGNADRHHYEIFKDNRNSMMLMLDNAKSFGNPYLHDPSILAPIRQCCIVRNSTYNKLLWLQNGRLTQLLEHAMESDFISPILSKEHLAAMNLRLKTLLATIDHCIEQNDKQSVLLKEWSGV